MELLAPAGTYEKLQYAINYGADAIYVGGKRFGLRAQAGNLTDKEIAESVHFCHERGKKLFVTTNIYAHNEDISEMPEYIRYLSSVGVDAVIVSEPGVFSIVQEVAPNLPIHISTQANVTSWKAAQFWSKLGAKRIILARELSRDEIIEIRQKVPEIELEIFVHGAMCISYSGRCLLSAYMNQRSANRGACTQPCRWKYSLVEETRPGQYFGIEEDQNGTYIMNSKDLCLWNELPDIFDIGIDSIKIEGRMKSIYYVANVTRAFKATINAIQTGQTIQSKWAGELDRISHRIYTNGFWEGFTSCDKQHYTSTSYTRDYQYIGPVIEVNGYKIKIQILAKFELGEKIEFVFPSIEDDFDWLVTSIIDTDGQSIPYTKPNTIVELSLDHIIPNNGLVRKQLGDQ